MSLLSRRLMLIALAATLLAAPVLGQENYIGKYNVFAGYAYLNSPALNLAEHGVQFQAGMRPRTWVALGFDYSNARGDATISPGLLPVTLQQSLGAQLAQLVRLGVIPASYQLVVPARSTTQTFALGPQLSMNRIKHISLFIRPSMGAMREVAVPHPTDAIATQIVKGLTPAGKKTDWTGFYGAGGGVDLRFSKHVMLRVQGDIVWDHLFNDILANGRRTYRFGIGPAFDFGKNVAE
jgi:hypothetical protein